MTALVKHGLSIRIASLWLVAGAAVGAAEAAASGGQSASPVEFVAQTIGNAGEATQQDAEQRPHSPVPHCTRGETGVLKRLVSQPNTFEDECGLGDAW